MLIDVSMNYPFSKIIPHGIPGQIFFMYGLKFAESVQIYKSGLKQLNKVRKYKS
jgi:hypothetical protein